ncbi:hypothetical protein SAMN05421788_112104 [Filimonas lacunae]|uniref:DUF393 domain-containing protein n=1 Tax=Filimonas lacunae TaxID=477680 RepID=A0A173MLD6_9BACT|nr:DUF393 domain-containing protein [Filimonas lacunae]BAV08296.1 hypothetical protein FLA_4332 [Filimonas lacunae]SIT33286.1 hypothetical protein SAMN05421788_112104 [Filimonas lacunae]
MKTLKDHLILYDADCPMCHLYTRAFVKAGMLDNNGREAYQHTASHSCFDIDMQRAVNEIALVNRQTGEVTYGIQSLFTIIAHSFPVFRRLFQSSSFISVMGRLYAFVSYNRRVIIPSADATHHLALQPSFKKRYRIAWLLFTWLVTAFILSAYAWRITTVLSAGGFYREYLVCGGQIIFQAFVLSRIAPQKTWDYLGNMMTVSLAGALLLLLGMMVGSLLHASVVFYVSFFMTVAGLMFLEHLRRCSLLGLNYIPSVTWVLYRLLLLAVLLKLY